MVFLELFCWSIWSNEHFSYLGRVLFTYFFLGGGGFVYLDSYISTGWQLKAFLLFSSKFSVSPTLYLKASIWGLWFLESQYTGAAAMTDPLSRNFRWEMEILLVITWSGGTTKGMGHTATMLISLPFFFLT